MLTMAGLDFQEVYAIPVSLDSNDVAILVAMSSFRDVVSVACLIDISLKTSISQMEVASRLSKLGFNVPVEVDSALILDSKDRQIVDRVQNMLYSGVVRPQIVIRAAVGAECSPWEAGIRLRRLGIQVENYDNLPTTSSELDLKAMSSNFDLFKFIPEGVPVPEAHIIRIAHQNRLSPRDVTRRLTSLGYQSPPEDQVPACCFDSDVKLLSWRELTSHNRWQDPYQPVSIANLIRAAIRCRISIMAAAARMTELGCRVPDLETVLPPLLARVPTIQDS